MTTKKIGRRTSILHDRRSARHTSASVRAQQTGLPDKPLKILVGFPAGGGTDVMARLTRRGAEATAPAATSSSTIRPAPRAPSPWES